MSHQHPAKTDIILAGVGGQGTLSIAAVLGRAALNAGLHIKQTEVHGMAQRGGAVQSHVRLSAEPVHSDVIRHGSATLILSMEPMEALRYRPWLAATGWTITCDQPVENIAYPPLETVHAELDRHPCTFRFDAVQLARDEGSPRSMNIAILGAATAFLPMHATSMEVAVAEQFKGKGAELVEQNLRVFRAARALADASGVHP